MSILGFICLIGISFSSATPWKYDPHFSGMPQLRNYPPVFSSYPYNPLYHWYNIPKHYWLAIGLKEIPLSATAAVRLPNSSQNTATSGAVDYNKNFFIHGTSNPAGSLSNQYVVGQEQLLNPHSGQKVINTLKAYSGPIVSTHETIPVPNANKFLYWPYNSQGTLSQLNMKDQSKFSAQFKPTENNPLTESFVGSLINTFPQTESHGVIQKEGVSYQVPQVSNSGENSFEMYHVTNPQAGNLGYPGSQIAGADASLLAKLIGVSHQATPVPQVANSGESQNKNSFEMYHVTNPQAGNLGFPGSHIAGADASLLAKLIGVSHQATPVPQVANSGESQNKNSFEMYHVTNPHSGNLGYPGSQIGGADASLLAKLIGVSHHATPVPQVASYESFLGTKPFGISNVASSMKEAPAVPQFTAIGVNLGTKTFGIPYLNGRLSYPVPTLNHLSTYLTNKPVGSTSPVGGSISYTGPQVTSIGSSFDSKPFGISNPAFSVKEGLSSAIKGTLTPTATQFGDIGVSFNAKTLGVPHLKVTESFSVPQPAGIVSYLADKSQHPTIAESFPFLHVGSSFVKGDISSSVPSQIGGAGTEHEKISGTSSSTLSQVVDSGATQEKQSFDISQITAPVEKGINFAGSHIASTGNIPDTLVFPEGTPGSAAFYRTATSRASEIIPHFYNKFTTL